MSERIYRHHIRRLALENVTIHYWLQFHDLGQMIWEEAIANAAFHLAMENQRLKEEVVRLERKASGPVARFTSISEDSMTDQFDRNAYNVAMRPLFEDADREGLWFQCNVHGSQYVFSPDELREANSRGKFLWGPVNWQLIHPDALSAAEMRRVDFERSRAFELLARISKWRAARGETPAAPTRMDLTEFREFGFLQEANRLFFHPLGLALDVICEADGRVSAIGGVWDSRSDPEGFAFAAGLIDKDRVARVRALRESKRAERVKLFGAVVQPPEGESCG